jgi:hypothetical protein
MSAALDLTKFGLVLMYVMLSFFCVIINEFIAGLLNLRGRALDEALKKLIDEPALRARFDCHGLIVGARGTTGAAHLSGAGRSALPPYLSSRSVAMALLGSLDPGVANPDMAQVRSAVDRLPQSNIKDVLTVALDDSGGDGQALRNDVAIWFDDAMTRLAGAYKRMMQTLSLVVALCIVIVLNADTIQISDALWRDQAYSSEEIKAGADAALQADRSTINVFPGCQAQNSDAIASTAVKLCVFNTYIHPRPLGWTLLPLTPLDWLTKIFGLLLTAIAVAIGASFWFDILQKYTNFRSTGERPSGVT